MATGKSYFARNNNYRFLSTDHHAPLAQDAAAFELDESDIYSTAHHLPISPEVRKPAAIRGSRKASQAVGATASSLPVNIPDWSKILKEEYRDQTRNRSGADDQGWNDYNDYDDNDVDGRDGSGARVPPHEFLARTRVGMASFSVHEGIGRTLKGRDLSRVRNAIWEKTGFQD